MKPPYEDLSKLMDGDLPPAEAAELRARIDADPALARANHELHALVGRIERLPEERPPAALDAAVLSGGTSPKRSWVRPIGAVALALAAAVALVVAWPRPDPARIVLVDGQELVDGDVALLAGDVPVEVRGLARISVEPRDRSARVPGAEEDPMIKLMGSGVGGALVGALVTVAVLDGTATVHAGGDAVVLQPGQTRTFRPAGGPATPIAPAPLPEGTPTEQIAALQAENTDLRTRLQEAQFSGAVARGQVQQTQGAASEWPKDVPPEWSPEQFEANLRAAVAAVPGVSVHEVDCAEYPCVATLTTAESGPAVADKLRTMADGLTKTTYPDAGMMVSVSTSDDGKGPESTAVGIAVVPPDRQDDADLKTRTNWRVSSLLDELHETAGTPAP